jgi:TonB family protein
MPSFRVHGSADETHGVVLLVAIITTRGRAVMVKVLKSLSPERDRQAVRVAENWTFKPASRIPDGAPLAAHASLEVAFRPD